MVLDNSSMQIYLAHAVAYALNVPVIICKFYRADIIAIVKIITLSYLLAGIVPCLLVCPYNYKLGVVALPSIDRI